jgi:hypothetical protein
MFLFILNTQKSITWVGNPYTKTSQGKISLNAKEMIFPHFKFKHNPSTPKGK